MADKYVKGAQVKKKYPVTGKLVSPAKVYGGYEDKISGKPTAGVENKGSVNLGKGK